MATLTPRRRKALPKSDFGEPGKRAYPMPDEAHAANAKARATQAVKAGRMSAATEAKIDAKADRKLKSKPARPGAKDGLGSGEGGLAIHSSASGAAMRSAKTMRHERY